MAKTNTLLIRTPEGIVFSQLLASPVTRCLAWLIDLLCLVVLGGLVGSLCGVLRIISIDFAQALAVLLYFGLSISYGILMEWYWRGQTIGKRLFRLRLLDAHGLRLQFSQVAIRNLLRFVDLLPMFYLVGGVACLVSRRAQRLGDFAANTIVVRNPKIGEPDFAQILAGKYNSFRAYPHLEARLRQRVSPAEADIALQTLLRRDLLDPASRVELFAEIATHLKSKADFPPEATEGLADEQYVRNVVAILYRPPPGAAAEKAKPLTPETALHEGR